MVAFKDFIKEASDLRPREVNKKVGTPEDRIPIFLNKVSQGAKFATLDGQEVIIDKSEIERLKNEILVPGYSGIPTLKTTDGTEIRMDQLAKTGEFGGTGQTKTGERILANRGNTLEGVLGALALARLTVRPSRRVSEVDLKKIINDFGKQAGVKGVGGSITVKAPEEQAKTTDTFSLTVKLPAKNYADFVDYDFMMADKQMAGFIRQSIAYVNEAGIVDRYAKMFESNGKADNVAVIADGVTDMTGRKTDIFMTYTDENGEKQTKKFDLSLKAGTTNQFGQAAVGADTPTSKKKAHSEYGWAAYKKIFGDFGVDISSVANEYLGAKGLEQAVDVAYNKAFVEFKGKLEGSDDDTEKAWLKQFVLNIKNHGTYNDPNVQLAQFEKSKYFVLDFQKLDRLLDRDKLDMGVRVTYTNSKDGTKWPRLDFVNTVDGSLFLRIRSKYSPAKVTNLIEKGPYFKEITTVRKNKPVKENMMAPTQDFGPNYNVVDDLHVYMRNNDNMYRKKYFPMLCAMQEALNAGKKINANKIMMPVIKDCMEAYNKEYGLAENTSDLITDEDVKTLVKKIYTEEIPLIKKGAYK
tara:strand:- start:30 stop:1769 length:1740 start_codon:yes stop_codon:yes gene_type:complete